MCFKYNFSLPLIKFLLVIIYFNEVFLNVKIIIFLIKNIFIKIIIFKININIHKTNFNKIRKINQKKISTFNKTLVLD